MRHRLIASLALLSAALPAAAAAAPATWVTDGDITAVVSLPSGHALVAGGFSLVAPSAGPGAALSIGRGTLDPSIAQVTAGAPTAVVADPGGDFYVAVALPRSGLVERLRADGSGRVAWRVVLDGPPAALALAHGSLYVGGSFDHAGTAVRRNVAALSAATGAVETWNPGADAPIDALAASAQRVYLGNSAEAGAGLHLVAGTKVGSLVGVDARSGRVVFHPPADDVRALALAGGVLAAGGYQGLDGNSFGLYDTQTGRSRPAPHVGGDDDTTVDALAASGSTVYIGGAYIGTVGTAQRRGAAAVDARSGAVLSWNPRVGVREVSTDANTVDALAIAGGKVYLAGDFELIAGRVQRRLAAVDGRTGAASAFRPLVGGAPVAIAASARAIYAGGIVSLGGVERGGLAIVRVSDGRPTSWSTRPHGRIGPVVRLGNALVAVVFMGGGARLRRVDLTTGASRWLGRVLPSGPEVMLADGGHLVIGLDVAGVYRLETIDARSGRLLTPTARLDYAPRALAVSGQSLLVALFGPAGSPAVIVLDRRTLRHVSSPLTKLPIESGLALAVGNDDLVVAAEPLSGTGQVLLVVRLGDGRVLSRLEMGTSTADVRAIAIANGHAWVGGSYDAVGGVARAGLAEIDLATGRVDPATPPAIGFVGALAASGGRILAAGGLAATGHARLVVAFTG